MLRSPEIGESFGISVKNQADIQDKWGTSPNIDAYEVCTTKSRYSIQNAQSKKDVIFGKH